MTMVNWERHSGEEVEQFVAAALVLEHGGGCRITPSRGDGGVDVLLPLEDGTWRVVQVKRYARALSARQAKEVDKSWRRFSEAGLEGLTVSQWTLAMPWDPTRERLAWLKSLPGKPVDYAIDWMGRTGLDVLAAKSPMLVDYYFGDGRRRTEELLATLLNAMEPTIGQGGQALLEGVTARLRTLGAALDEIDPFYWYELNERIGEPPAADELLEDTKGAAMVSCWVEQPGRYWMLRIIPRSPLSAQLRPIRGTMQFVVDRGSAADRALRDFFDYGAPFADLEGDLVDRQGPPGTMTEGRGLFTVRPLAAADSPPIEFRVMEGDLVLSALDLQTPRVATAPVGDGMYFEALDSSNHFTVTVRFAGPHRRVELNFAVTSMAGARAVDVADLAEFLAELKPERSVSIAMRRGPELMAPFVLEQGMELAWWAGIVRLFVRLQAHTIDQVLLPDADQLTELELKRLHNVVELLDGKSATNEWQEWTLTPVERTEWTPEVGAVFEMIELVPIEMPLAGVNVKLDQVLRWERPRCEVVPRLPGSPDGSVTVIPQDGGPAVLTAHELHLDESPGLWIQPIP